jgi:hypothetical protein
MAEAREQYALVRAQRQLAAANGVAAEPQFALFETNHGDPATAYADARAAFERRPTVFAADAAAWAAFKLGRIDEARRLSAESTRLGTREPALLERAQIIAAGH